MDSTTTATGITLLLFGIALIAQGLLDFTIGKDIRELRAAINRLINIEQSQNKVNNSFSKLFDLDDARIKELERKNGQRD